MSLAIAALLTSVIDTPSEARVEAYVDGVRCWIAFTGTHLAPARATILAAHQAKMARIQALGFALDADTRVLLMVRFNLEGQGPVRQATSWTSPAVLPAPEICAA